MKFRKNYEPSVRSRISFAAQGRTKQSMKDECDIMNIMRRFETTGELPHMIQREPHFGDFSEPIEFKDAMNIVNHANAQFEALPSRVRERFGNNPQNFLEFATNPANLEEMVKLGLATKKPVASPPEPQKVIVVDAPKPKKAPAGKPDGGQA